jgi:1-acyl-sn-glycerol-3-phosphate acyltransferase
MERGGGMIGSIRIGLALLLVCIATLLMLPLQMLALKTGLFSPGIIPRIWHRMALKALGLRVHVRGKIAPQRPLLIASNHISWTDIMVIGSLAEVAFIAKSDVAGWPVFGSLARLQRTVFVERERKGRSGDQAGEIAGRLAGNDAVVLFAEGSTGDGNHLLPFKSTLFGAARLALGNSNAETVYIQPVAIAYTKLHGMPMGRQHRVAASWIGDADLVPHLLEVLRERAMDVEVQFGEPLEFNAGSDRKQVARRVEGEVRTMMLEALRTRQRAR